MKKVFLSGGLHSNWQDVVMTAVPGCIFLDPRSWQSGNFFRKDLKGVDECDILFAYLEKSNPGGYGLCIEISRAEAKGKFIIFVNEKDDKYLKFAEEISNIVTYSFAKGVKFLNILLRLHAKEE